MPRRARLLPVLGLLALTSSLACDASTKREKVFGLSSGTLVFHPIGENARQALLASAKQSGAFCRATLIHRQAIVTAGHCGSVFFHRLRSIDPKLSQSISRRIVDRTGREVRSVDTPESYHVARAKDYEFGWRTSFVPDAPGLAPQPVDAFAVPTNFVLHDAGRTAYQHRSLQKLEEMLRTRCVAGVPPLLRAPVELSALSAAGADQLHSYGRERSDEEARDLCIMKLRKPVPAKHVAKVVASPVGKTSVDARTSDDTAQPALKVFVRRPKVSDDMPLPHPRALLRFSRTAIRLRSELYHRGEDPLFEGASFHRLRAADPTGVCTGDSGTGVFNSKNNVLTAVISSQASPIQLTKEDYRTLALRHCACSYHNSNRSPASGANCPQRPSMTAVGKQMTEMGAQCGRYTTAASLRSDYFRQLFEDARTLLRIREI